MGTAASFPSHPVDSPCLVPCSCGMFQDRYMSFLLLAAAATFACLLYLFRQLVDFPSIFLGKIANCDSGIRHEAVSFPFCDWGVCRHASANRPVPKWGEFLLSTHLCLGLPNARNAASRETGKQVALSPRSQWDRTARESLFQ